MTRKASLHMIVGNCNHCNESFWIPLQEGCGFSREICEKCGGVFWLSHSRIDPESWTEDEFDKWYSVDKENKVVTKRPVYTVKLDPAWYKWRDALTELYCVDENFKMYYGVTVDDYLCSSDFPVPNEGEAKRIEKYVYKYKSLQKKAYLWLMNSLMRRSRKGETNGKEIS